MDKEKFLKKVEALEKRAWDDDLVLWLSFDGLIVNWSQSVDDAVMDEDFKKLERLIGLLFEKSDVVEAYVGESLESIDERILLKGTRRR